MQETMIKKKRHLCGFLLICDRHDPTSEKTNGKTPEGKRRRGGRK